MQNAQPEPHDFQFNHNGFNYCIGYQNDEFTTFAMSRCVDTGNQWSWAVSEQIHNEDLSKWGGAMGFLDYFLPKCNAQIDLDEEAPEPPVDEFELLLHTVQHNLTFSPVNGVTVK